MPDLGRRRARLMHATSVQEFVTVAALGVLAVPGLQHCGLNRRCSTRARRAAGWAFGAAGWCRWCSRSPGTRRQVWLCPPAMKAEATVSLIGRLHL